MPTNMTIKVDGVKIKNPTYLQIDFNYISDAERSLSGDMTIDGVSGKIKLTLEYDEISLDEFKTVTGLTWNAFLQNKSKIKQHVSLELWGENAISFNSYIAPNSIKIDTDAQLRRKLKNFKLEFTETTGETFIFD
jgi:hypothetical protein